MNILIDLFDHSGHAAKPYLENGWHVIQVDIKHGIDILTWDYKTEITKAIQNNWHYSAMPKIGLLAAIPCTDYANSGAKHFERKDADGSTAKSQLLVDKVYEIKCFIEQYFSLSFWRVENPMSRIHKLNPWLGGVTHKHNPCDYAGYNLIPAYEMEQLNSYRGKKMSEVSKTGLQMVIQANLYNKQTWLWGTFNIPPTKRIEPIWKDSPMFVLYGGKSERTKELRSVDPQGFCNAFYQYNH